MAPIKRQGLGIGSQKNWKINLLDKYFCNFFVSVECNLSCCGIWPKCQSLATRHKVMVIKMGGDHGQWTGAPWTGAPWTGAPWTGAPWTGAPWAGAPWAGAPWTGAPWTGAPWTGAPWTGAQEFPSVPYLMGQSDNVIVIPCCVLNCTGVGTEGARGACAPHTFQSGGQRYVCAPPLSDPEFRDVPPAFCHVPTPLNWNSCGLWVPYSTPSPCVTVICVTVINVLHLRKSDSLKMSVYLARCTSTAWTIQTNAAIL